MSKSKVWVIGIDSLDKDLVERWAGDGHLPVFRRLFETALWGDIENPRGLEAGSCWPTLAAGVGPAHTGQFEGARLFDPQTYRHVPYRPNASKVPPLWLTLSEAGKLCAVIDFPYSFPVAEINGLKIADRAPHVPSGGGTKTLFRTYPKALVAEIIEKFGPDPAGGLTGDDFKLTTPEELEHFRDVYLERIENKTDLTLHYLREQSWDFFVSVLTEAHDMGHRCWHVHDPNHPDHDPDIAARLGDPLKDVYVAMDRAVGRIMELAQKDTRIIVYLSHGMGPRYSGTWLLDRILARLENKDVATKPRPIMATARAVWRRLPPNLKRHLGPLRDSIAQEGFQPNREVRRFFEVYASDRTGGIRINLAGREPKGIVQPGHEYDQMCDRLISHLKQVVNDETGEPLVAEFIKVRDQYEGPYLDRLPDILLTWNQSGPINAARSPEIGRVDKTGLKSPRTGDHRPTGRFFAVAPDWQHRKLEGPVRAQDFAPTITKLLGVELTKTDGEVIPGFFENDQTAFPQPTPQSSAAPRNA